MKKPETIKAILVDDSAQARKLLRLMLTELAPDVIILGEAENLEQAVALIHQTKPDVVFLDIEMPGKSGLQLVEEINRKDLPFEIIFTTAYNEFAIRAFRISAADYLLKPIDEQQLLESVEKIRKLKATGALSEKSESVIKLPANGNILAVPALNGYLFLKTEDILYIKASGSYAEISQGENEETILVSKNLKYFEDALIETGRFIRIHRSWLINLSKLKGYDKAGGGWAIMENGKRIAIARERKDAFLNAIGKAEN